MTLRQKAIKGPGEILWGSATHENPWHLDTQLHKLPQAARNAQFRKAHPEAIIQCIIVTHATHVTHIMRNAMSEACQPFRLSELELFLGGTSQARWWDMMRQDETMFICKISTRNPSIKISKSTRLLAILRCTLNSWLHFWVHSWLLLWDLRRTFPAHHWHTRRLVCDLFSTLRADRLSRTSMTHTFSWSQTIGPPQHKCSSMFIM